MDGLADRLGFIATAGDDLNVKAAKREFKLASNATLTEVLQARKQVVRDALRETLGSLATRLAEKAEDQGESLRRFLARLASPNLFMVSAEDYVALQEAERTRLMESVEQTEMPALQEYTQGIATRFGLQGHLQSIARQRRGCCARSRARRAARRWP